jgi:hypothetical protein
MKQRKNGTIRIKILWQTAEPVAIGIIETKPANSKGAKS